MNNVEGFRVSVNLSENGADPYFLAHYGPFTSIEYAGRLLKENGWENYEGNDWILRKNQLVFTASINSVASMFQEPKSLPSAG